MQPESPSPWSVVAAVFVGLWTVGVTWLTQSGWWLVADLLPSFGLDAPPAVGVAVGLVNALFVAVPAALLRLSGRPAVRAAGTAWLLGAGLIGMLAASRAVPAAYHEWLLFCQLVLFGVCDLVLRRRGRERGGRLWGLAAGLAVALPWAWAGSLGGWFETFLAVLVAVAVGGCAGSLLDWGPFRALGTARRLWCGGLVAGVALLLVGASAGAAGQNLLLMALLPPLGFAAAALHRPLGVAALVGAATLGPLVFVDPEELSLLLNLETRDIGYWALIATAGSLAIALLLFLLYGLAVPRDAGRPLVAGMLAALLLVAGAGVYFGAGRPGFHGDRLFVILKSQASLDGVRGAAVQPFLRGHAEETQHDLLAALKGRGLGYRSYYLVNAVEVDASDPVTRSWLSDRGEVDRILHSPRLRPLPEPLRVAKGDLPAPTGPGWNLDLIGAPTAWAAGARGQGIVIGTSDSGVGMVPAVADAYRGGADSWYDPWNGSRTPQDHGGHGTHTLGSALGRGGIGVAPEARWIGCVNLDRNMANPAYYLDCLQFMLAPGGDPTRAPNVLTNSWGCPASEGCDPGALSQALRGIKAAGIYFVAAAGNSGPGCGTAADVPALYPESLTVGAVNRNSEVASFSSRGPAGGRVKPDVVAPGAGVVSAMPGGGYAALDGTSMATPHVAGVVALMWSANPALVGDIDRTTAILRSTASPVTKVDKDSLPIDGCDGNPENVRGAGLVDAAAAVAAAREVR
ncbi:S8 family serine peptidase [Longispora sp. NPDC051575]|uniref:S8 family serine peptidase n=1 Tax=Longispora sp. NPDC051575 TaxID=3154943 RepID=UPI003427245F